MENRITVTICGTDYTLMAEESPSYMQKVAALVDGKMNELMTAGHLSRMDADRDRERETYVADDRDFADSGYAIEDIEEDDGLPGGVFYPDDSEDE